MFSNMSLLSLLICFLCLSLKIKAEDDTLTAAGSNVTLFKVDDSYLPAWRQTYQENRTIVDIDFETQNYEYMQPANTLEKRVDWTWCLRNNENMNTCFAGLAIVEATAFGIATLVTNRSKAKECGLTSVYYSSVNGINVYYRYKAEGKNCDTTAQFDTVKGAMEKWLREANYNEVCAFQCTRGTHGGTYKGYMSFGTNYNLVKNTACDDSSATFNTCESGGKNDAT